MNYFFAQHLIFIPFVAYIVATLLKGFFLWQKSRFNLQAMLSTGGMPSGHSALVASLATGIGIKYGPLHDLFVLALVFAAIVIYDAMNIRYQSGLHAHALNKLKGEKQLNESLGHLPSETLVGSMIGVFVAAVLMQI
jgi:acid phosphatase family membrane protein YuiD